MSRAAHDGEEAMLRIVKILLILSVAAYCLLSVADNIVDWRHVMGSIGGVTSMATVDGGAGWWQATKSPVVIALGWFGIVVFKILGGVGCAAGGWRMWAARRADAATFAQAKSLALAGCGVAVLGVYLGWTVIGEQVFEMWRSHIFAQAANTAFRYGGSIALIAVFVGMRED
ncbi:DUF2165 family protein [Sphingomonas bacterium]|uniref:DUF2165 family protein n=1 Tax=Sphingomonas bacterium TaxID=1895847 RepID=UPI00157714F8|nr:DUF2165 family protein [Sphingomonas bacterium]